MVFVFPNWEYEIYVKMNNESIYELYNILNMCCTLGICQRKASKTARNPYVKCSLEVHCTLEEMNKY